MHGKGVVDKVQTPQQLLASDPGPPNCWPYANDPPMQLPLLCTLLLLSLLFYPLAYWPLLFLRFAIVALDLNMRHPPCLTLSRVLQLPPIPPPGIRSRQRPVGVLHGQPILP